MASHDDDAQQEQRHPVDWEDEVRNGGSLPQVSLETGTNGWSPTPGHVFLVRGSNYLNNKKQHKVSAGECLLRPLGMDWLQHPSSSGKLDHVLSRSDNRIMHALRKAQGHGLRLKSFVFAVNLQVPPAGRDHHRHSAVFYFFTEEAIAQGSLLYDFIHGDDAFRNSRFKLINRIVRGPWIVRATVGNHAACLLGKALTCTYIKGPNYLEIDVDIGSSALASAIVHLALGYVSSVCVDLAFLIEAQEEEELPERIVGAVRIAQIEMSSAEVVEDEGEGLAPSQAHSSNGGSSWWKFSRSAKIEADHGKGKENN